MAPFLNAIRRRQSAPATRVTARVAHMHMQDHQLHGALPHQRPGSGLPARRMG